MLPPNTTPEMADEVRRAAKQILTGFDGQGVAWRALAVKIFQIENQARQAHGAQPKTKQQFYQDIKDIVNNLLADDAN